MSYDWTLQTNGPNLNWSSIASSSDGTRICGCGSYGNNIVYTGLQSGSTWNWTQQTSLPNVGWNSITSNSDGTMLAVCGSNVVYTGVFENSNWIWSPQQISGVQPNVTWSSIASNSSGNNLVIVENAYGNVCTGEFISSTWSWTLQTNGLPSPSGVVPFFSTASDSTGTKLVVAGYNNATNNNIVYTGVFDGTSWTWTNVLQISVSLYSTISSVASNSLGDKLVLGILTGSVYTGLYDGISWTWTPQIDLPNVPWYSVASNSLGDRIVVGGVNTYVYTGVLTGTTVTWIQQTTIGNNIWFSVASDSTGNNIFAGIQGNYLYTGLLEAPCFLKGSKILTANGYEKIENLKKGDLIETYRNGLKEINLIGKREIYHQANKERIKDILYKYSKNEYIEYLDGLTEDLIITGGHSILVDDFKNDRERKKNKDLFQEKYPIIDGKHRLLACVDENASIYEKEGKYFIYHLALESEDEDQAYGIYANGMLVESCAIKYLKEVSGMELL